MKCSAWHLRDKHRWHHKNIQISADNMLFKCCKSMLRSVFQPPTIAASNLSMRNPCVAMGQVLFAQGIRCGQGQSNFYCKQDIIIWKESNAGAIDTIQSKAAMVWIVAPTWRKPNADRSSTISLDAATSHRHSWVDHAKHTSNAKFHVKKKCHKRSTVPLWCDSSSNCSHVESCRASSFGLWNMS